MTTPLIMLFLTVAPYSLAWAWSRAKQRPFDRRRAGAVGLALLFAFTGLGHFIQTEPMAQMLPRWVPVPVLLVYLTGILEYLIALGLAFDRTRYAAGWVAAAALVLFFPVNVYAAINRIPIGGHAWGWVYLLVRGPLQLFLLAWVYWFCLRLPHMDLWPTRRTPGLRRS
jgi:uncharacterized membrane protein